MWVEIDSFDPRALALIRRSIGTPLASCESLFGRRQFKDFFENYAMDVGIIDLPWNGILESMKIAAMAEAYEVNCAPHNFYGHMSTLMSAHFCAAIPNFRIMEIDIDDVPWKDDLVTEPPRIENGHLIMPTKPGWGADINEDVVKRHPPKWYPSVTTMARGGTEYEQSHQRCRTHGLKAVAPAGSKALPFLDVAAAGGYDLSFKLSVLAVAPGLLVASRSCSRP
jgi:hypothetical protein